MASSPGDGGSPLVATAVWRARPEVIVALDDRFGEPVDAYVNGSQVWLRDDGPGGIAIEWRLHPVAGYRRPPARGVYAIFEGTALALVERSAALVGTHVDPVELRAAAMAYVEQVSERVADDDEAAAYVASLEEADDLEQEDVSTIPSGDALAAEVERFLRDEHRD